VPREPRPGEAEEILAEEVGLQVDGMLGTTRGPDGAPVLDALPATPPAAATPSLATTPPATPPAGAAAPTESPGARPAPG
jgi:hypothetical protein